MNRTIRTMFVVLATVVALTAVSAVWAADCTETVTGTVTAINADFSSITVDGVTVKQIALGYLANQFDIVLVEGVSQVVITGELCMLAGVVRACTISVDGGEVIELPGN